jgi:hypothetical protein
MTEFIEINAEDKPSFVIRSQYVVELNAAYNKEPAKVYNLTRDGKESVSIITEKEYTRLKKILLSAE